MRSILFDDRAEAGRQLAKKLVHLKLASPLVLALPRGGVPVGIEIAHALGAPLELLLVRKIGVPWQPELAVGAVVDGANPCIVVNDDVARAAGISKEEIDAAAEEHLREIGRRRELWLKNRPRIPISGHDAIIVDDGIATGASVRAALSATHAARAAHVILAVPVAPFETAESIRADCDEAVFLETPEDFIAVGAFYRDFRQLTDQDVARLLAE